MEQLPINHNGQYVHENLGVTEERLQELEKEIHEKIFQELETNGIISEDSEKKELIVRGSYAIDLLVNKIPKTEQERIVLLLQLDNIMMAIDMKLKQMYNGLQEAE